MFPWIILFLVCFLSIIFYTRIVRPYRSWMKLPIAHVPNGQLLYKMGNIWKGRKNITIIFDEIYKSYSHKPYVGMYFINEPILMITKPEIANQILIKDFNYFRNKLTRKQENDSSIGAHLINLCDDQWRNTRAKIMTLFGPGPLKRMFPLVEDSVDDLEDHLRQFAETGQSVNIKDIVLDYLIDVMGKYVFGFKLNTIKYPDKGLRKFGRTRILTSHKIYYFVRLVLQWIHPALAKWVGVGLTGSEIERIFKKLLQDAMKQGQSNQESAPNFLNLMLDIQNQEKQRGIPEDDMLTDVLLSANVFILFAAGLESSAVTLSCCLYELALNQDIQNKVRDEIRKATQNSKLCYNTVTSDITYLDMVISETLRKYSPIPILPRVCTQNYILPGTTATIKEGTKIMIPVYSFHKDPQYYETPEKFLPERFADFDKFSKPYLPFGDGPRICPGKKLARDELKYCLARLLSKYSFAPTEQTEIPLQMEEKAVFFSVKSGILLSVNTVAA